MRKAEDNVLARTAAERVIGDLIAPSTDGEVDGLAKGVVGAFETVEFETAVSKVRGGSEVHLRRLVLTSAWEVDPNGGK